MTRGLPLDQLPTRCVRTPDGHELWPGALHNGYATAARRGRRLRLHRLVVELADGITLPSSVQVRHVCPGEPRRNCLARGHLATGSAADNVHDMVALGRQARGERHGLHRLTEQAVRRARRQRAQGATYVSIARRLGVAPSTMRRAIVGECWGWLS
jgi:hypothetical protein